jgi:hypothetical protein
MRNNAPRTSALNNTFNLQNNLNSASPFNLSSPEWNIKPGNTNNEYIPRGLMMYNLPSSKPVSKENTRISPRKPFKLGKPPGASTGGSLRRRRTRRGTRSRRRQSK